jgi:acyl-CoA thioesterase-1
MAIYYNSRTRMVFIGDDVTDAGRSADVEGLGHGYVRMIRDILAAKDPPTAPTVVNRGAAGARIIDLDARWEADVLELKPDVLSILIGMDGGLPRGDKPPAGIEAFRAMYRQILQKTADALPACKVVLCEPTAVWSRTATDIDPNVRPYVESLNRIAVEFKAEVVVPLHSAFVYARQSRPDITWFGADEKLTSTGHMLIAQAWLEATDILNFHA